ncbi:triose-phosphate transporter family-domain-containing protein [Gymnopilus junonius]|uniref:Triose-phosphate transporter family-domain-containing protein n=1 Tax=Gymnopilus junonius TaxID=109634 RepID=A0A9P5NVR5_GYMJU|nr:triose-phosphate transporter family-domain-containing protein [Gymnopilus junonius]
MTSNALSSNFLFVLLCSLWYTTSALSSNTGKAILNQFRYPVTLTFVQFGFVAFYCLLFMSPAVRFSKFRKPTKAITWSTLPMGLFQVGGHIFSSIAISRIPVSTVHTIKALSPLFTVAAYALFFGVSYSSKTYLSLLPLTVGVMLACSFDVSASNTIGLLSAFGSALVFVSSNIFFKKIMPSNGTSSHKLDKMNLLLYSSGTAFLLMVPIWVYYDLPVFLSGNTSTTLSMEGPPAHSVAYYFFMNGTVHYAQNIIAFVILSSTSPVTYSIASLIKRVAVICIAIVWFNQAVHPIQAFGIVMTFTGLYMYNNAKGDVEKGEKKLRKIEATREMMLPTTKEDVRILTGVETPPSELLPDYQTTEAMGMGSGSIYGGPKNGSISAALGHPTYSQQHHRPPPGNPLHIKTLDNIPTMKEQIGSPVVLYPSPPPSNDSPPSDTIPLPALGDGYGFSSENEIFHSIHRQSTSALA